MLGKSPDQKQKNLFQPLIGNIGDAEPSIQE